MYGLKNFEKLLFLLWKRALSGLSRTSLLLIKGYQFLVSPFLGGRCRFEPSCSQYAKEAFQSRPFFTALKMTAVRLSSCHPFGRFGYDPVIKED